jgi:hypothetical protein
MNILHVISGIELAGGAPSKSVSDLAKVREELAAPEGMAHLVQMFRNNQGVVIRVLAKNGLPHVL